MRRGAFCGCAVRHATSKTWRRFIKKASCGAAQQENIFIEIDEQTRVAQEHYYVDLFVVYFKNNPI